MVEVDGKGQSDRLDATGRLTIDPDARVVVKALPASADGRYFEPFRLYTIATAADGVTGTFGGVDEDYLFLDAALFYDPTHVQLRLTRNNFRFADAAFTANQRATAGELDRLGVDGLSFYGDLTLLGADDSRKADDTLSGEVHASVPPACWRRTRPSCAALRLRRPVVTVATRSGAGPGTRFRPMTATAMRPAMTGPSTAS